jgi:UDP-2,3-diacylglucosamine pyrophosphatase LpxH
MAKQKREVEVVILSDIHLGTYGCHAKELVAYLKSVSPKVLILNGDVIDGWAFLKIFSQFSHVGFE